MTIAIPPTNDFSYNGVIVHKFHANVGEGLPKHEHLYSHATMCCNGSCIVRKENKEYLLTKNSAPINLIAGEWHEIEALEDNTVFVNIFAENKY